MEVLKSVELTPCCIIFSRSACSSHGWLRSYPVRFGEQNLRQRQVRPRHFRTRAHLLRELQRRVELAAGRLQLTAQQRGQALQPPRTRTEIEAPCPSPAHP